MRHPESESFYDLLGVGRDATPGEIRAAFLKLAQRHHPDLNADDPGADRRFKQIRRVYEILCDPLRRAAYDDHPHHFRLNDADIVSNDAGPIVTNPATRGSAESFWSGRDRLGRKSAYRPGWLADRRFRRESRLAFVGMMATMVVLAVISVLLVRARGKAISGNTRTIAAEPIGHTTPTAGDAVHDSDISPLEQVISSVRDLRANAAIDRVEAADGGEAADESTMGPLPRRTTMRPPFNIMDELNLPFPGWPLIPPPLEVPLIDPPPSDSTDGARLLPPTSDNLMVRSDESKWHWPTPSSVPQSVPPARTWDSFDPDRPRHPLRPLPPELETAWNRAAGVQTPGATRKGTSVEPPPMGGASFTTSAFSSAHTSVARSTGFDSPSVRSITEDQSTGNRRDSNAQRRLTGPVSSSPPARLAPPSPMAPISPVVGPVLPIVPPRARSYRAGVATDRSYAGLPHWPVGPFTSGQRPTRNETENVLAVAVDDFIPRPGLRWPTANSPLSIETQRTMAAARVMAAGGVSTDASPARPWPRRYPSGLPASRLPPSALPGP
jgi:hypothetical protein